MDALAHISLLRATASLNFYLLPLCEVAFKASLNININFMLDCAYIWYMHLV